MELTPEGWKPGCDVRITRLNSFWSVEYTVQEGTAMRVLTEKINPEAVAYLEFRDFEELRHFLVHWFDGSINTDDIDEVRDISTNEYTSENYRPVKIKDWFDGSGQVALQSSIVVSAHDMAYVIAGWVADLLGGRISNASLAAVEADLSDVFDLQANGIDVIMYRTLQSSNIIRNVPLGGRHTYHPDMKEETLNATFTGKVDLLHDVVSYSKKVMVGGRHWVLTSLVFNHDMTGPINAEVEGRLAL